MVFRSALALLLVSLLFFGINPYFFSIATVSSILTSSAELGIVVLGITILMIGGEFDLSVGANFALSGMFFSYLLLHQVNSVTSLILAIGLSSLVGLFNGLITLSLQIPSFITTLGTMLICRGLVFLFTDGFPVTIDQSNSVMVLFASDLGQGFLTSILWFMSICLYLEYLLVTTKWGNHIQACGSNSEAAYSLGVSVTKIKLFLFTLCGSLAGLGGIIQVCHLKTLAPTAGEQYELYAIAAAVIGGTSLKGGIGSLIGAMLGILLINTVDTGLVQAGVSIYWYRILVGIILITAVAFNRNSIGFSVFKKAVYDKPSFI